MKTLVVYYSYSENGDTAQIARRLSEAVGADTERLELVTPYPDDYDKVLELSKAEVESGATPAIKALKHNPADYDMIAVGTPTWWYSMAPAILTFLKSTDLGGKTVLPFTTHGGQTGHTVDDIRKNATGAKVLSGHKFRLDAYGAESHATPDEDIEKWLDAVKAFVGK